MARNILLITTDQMRYDALGCNGGVARTPVLDQLAGEGVNYSRAHCQSVVCMPARSTILTGQHVATHGVRMNGVPLPEDSPSVADVLQRSGYRTALVGKAHFTPWLAGDSYYENAMATRGEYGPHRGFEHMELANHFFLNHSHYDLWLKQHHAGEIGGFYPIVDEQGRQNAAGGGDTGAVQVWHNQMPVEHYHTHWVGERCRAWLDSLAADDKWFLWMSFPDPHHPWDPPVEALQRMDWRDLQLPAGYPQTAAEREAILAEKPAHWLDAYRASRHFNMEMPPGFVPAEMTADQVREINAMNHIENELIDEACGNVLSLLDERGWTRDTDIFFTTDHGELQGDFGLMFKGPFHVDALMRLPFIWKPAPAAGVPAGTVSRPVGQVDLAPTFVALAGLEPEPCMEGQPLPTSDAEADDQERQHVLTEWYSSFASGSEGERIDMGLHSIYLDSWLYTGCLPGDLHSGDEGELYNLAEDPLQRVNLWDDPACRQRRDDMAAQLRRLLPSPREPELQKASEV